MPRFYLHLCDGGGFLPDEDGLEFADLQVAREAAILGLRDTMAGEIWKGELDIGALIEIEDEHGQLVDTVHFADAVRIVHKPVRRPARLSRE
jgi:hypothetical protein